MTLVRRLAPRRAPIQALLLSLLCGAVLVSMASAQPSTPKTPKSPKSPAGSGAGTGNSTTGAGPMRERTLPHEDYFRIITGLLDDGQYRDAEKNFKATWRVALRDVDGRWIDSICHYTMIGESQYRQGNTAEALENFNQAMLLFIRWRNYMLRVQFSDVTPSMQASETRPVPWGVSKRGAKPGHYADKMPIAQGQIDNSDVVRRGGVVRQATYRVVVVPEVVRCTALAMYRRREILGPVCKYDPITPQLTRCFSEALTPARHWSESWVMLEQGLAYANADQPTQAIESLKRSLLLGGVYDHSLSGIALLSMGRLYLEAGKLEEAADSFLEASYASFRYPDNTVLEEALRYGQMTHLLSGKRTLYPPLAKAYEWAKVKRMRELEVSMCISMAECYSVGGKLPQARQWLEEAKTRIGNRDMIDSRLGARWNLLNAQVNYQLNNRRAADDALAAALKFQRVGSTRLFQISGTDRLSKTLSPRLALTLYAKVLGEITSTEWSIDPLEALAVMSTPHAESFDNWFEIAISEKHHEEAIEIAELARRHKFFSSLPLGGRVMALRWTLEGPEDVLTEAAAVRKQDLLARYPKYAELSKKARQLRETLKAAPLAPAEQDAALKQRDLVGQLATVSNQQEVILHEMAVRREPSEFMFPPIRRTSTITKSLPNGSALWIFYSTRQSLYGFMLTNSQYDYWRVGDTDRLKKELPILLRGLGNYGQNNELTTTLLKDPTWQKSGHQIAQILLKGSKVDLGTLKGELIIVPDGPMWYLPFEALPSGAADDAAPLISKTRIRYLPFASLAAPYRKTTTPFGKGSIAVRAGKLTPRDDASVAVAATDELKQALPNVAKFDSYANSPSPVLASLFDDLIVYDEIQPGSKGPYDWSPTQLDKSSAAGNLDLWYPLPFGGPEHVLLPGFRTAAENGLKSKLPGGGDGQDMFLATAGLMANGARTVLLSRWRVGGKSAYDLTREFAQELPQMSASEAWQRSVQLAMQAPLDPAREPRVKLTGDDGNATAAHPFFWSGYMLADMGEASKGVELQVEQKDAKPPLPGDAAAAIPPPAPERK
jgi:tetratricopeptide (TPR) repeat protein